MNLRVERTYFKNMKFEKIFLFFMKAIITIVAFIIFIFVWKYLNKKSLGMQTLIDYMIKDYIIICTILMTVSWFLHIEIKLGHSLEYVLALFVIMFNYFWLLVIFWQIFATMIIRYLTIFYQPLLNNYEDNHVRIVTRIFIGKPDSSIRILEKSNKYL